MHGIGNSQLRVSSLFISFSACDSGLIRGCRCFIGIDGANLKGQYDGTLLSAITWDRNNQVFLVAWAIVSGEDQET